MTRNVIRTCQGEEPTNTRSGPRAAWADALFVSMLQRSDRPSTGQARQAIAAAIDAFSGRGCAERVHRGSAITRRLQSCGCAGLSRWLGSAGSARTPNGPR